MKILALNATYQPEATTTRLTRAALEGASSLGADTEMILLCEKDIGFCANCLTCYQDLESEIGQCVMDDDVRGILENIKEADGVLLASPVHNGFVTGLMTVFLERVTWTLCRPTGEIMGMRGAPEPRLTNKARACASLVSAGLAPNEMRAYCDLGTPWLRDMAPMLFNGEFVADMYAGAFLTKELEGKEHLRGFFFRELTDAQLKEAFELGVKLVEALQEGKVQPFDPMRSLSGISQDA